MHFFPSPKIILGLDISDLSLKAVQLKKKNGLYFVAAINNIEVAKGLIEDGIIKNKAKVADLIKKLISGKANKFTTAYGVVSLPETKTFIKVIEVSQKESRETPVREIIKKELPRHLPVATDEVELDWQEVSSDHKNRKFLIGAAPKDIVGDYAEVCRLAGLEVVALEVEAQAITRAILPFAEKTKPKKSWRQKIQFVKASAPANAGPIVNANLQPRIILDLGANRTGLIFWDNGTIQFANSIANISGEKITAQIMNEKKLNFADAEKAKLICGTNPKKCKGAVKTIIEEVIDELTREIFTALTFYEHHFGSEANDLTITVCGGGAGLSNIEGIFKEKLSKNIQIANPLINICGELPRTVKNIMSYTTAIGLALRQIE